MDGVLVVDKPAGMTSHDVVNQARRRLGTKRVGHAGTLDPDATGILVLGVGKATRLLSYAQAWPKRYVAVVRFGATTTTGDASGRVVARRPARLTPEALEQELPAFVGEIEQVPPMVSAVKIGGERLYRKARRGEDVERPARRVVVHELRLVDFRHGDEPEAKLEVLCSAGTYIRTLASDLGDRIGCGAHLVSLRRTEAGGFSEEDAVALEGIEAARLRPMLEAVRLLPRVAVDPALAARVAHGQALEPSALGRLEDLDEGAPLAVVSDGDLLAIYARLGDRLRAQRVLSA